MKYISILLTALFFLALAPEFSAQIRHRKPAPKKAAIQRLDETPAPAAANTSAFIPGPVDKEGWRPYESKEDLFKASFPPTPVVTDTLDENGRKDGARYYNPEPVTPAKLSLTLMVTPLGTLPIDAEFKRRLYNGWVEGVMGDDGSGKKAVKILDKEFPFGDSFGLEVIVDREDFRFHGKIMCPVGKCYQLAVGSASPRAVKPEEYAEINRWKEKFFDSFQVIKAPVDPFYGKTIGGVYTNDIIGFSLQLPAGWFMLDLEKKPDDEKVKKILSGDNKYYNKLLDDSLKVERGILRTAKKPAGDPGNASLGISVQKLQPGKSNLTINAETTRRILAAGNLAPTVSPVQFKYLGKTRVAILDVGTAYNGIQVKQRLYFAHHRGNVISIVLSYLDDMDLLIMEKSVQTLQFK